MTRGNTGACLFVCFKRLISTETHRCREPDSLPKKVNRRQCLKTAAAASAACLVPTMIPASALGRGGATAPSERIVLGAIGMGSRGEYDLKWMLREKDIQFVAICDARKVRREAIKQIADQHYGSSDCQMYPEMGEFLATRPDIDALLIATGDRWHSLAACHGDAGR